VTAAEAWDDRVGVARLPRERQRQIVVSFCRRPKAECLFVVFDGRINASSVRQ
jgi:hypothetical protein